MSIKEHIAGEVKFKDYNNGTEIVQFAHKEPVVFSRYRKGYLYFLTADNKEIFIEVPHDVGHLVYTTSTGIDFQVPLSDTGDADFYAKDKGIMFMRYIRKVV